MDRVKSPYRLIIHEKRFAPITRRGPSCSGPEQARFQALMQAYHYLGALPKIGNTLWYVATQEDEWLALLSFFRRRFEVWRP